MQRFIKHPKLTLIILLSPAIIFFTVFVFATFVYNVFLSFFNWKGVGALDFAGLSNWQKLLGDSDYMLSLKNTTIIFVGIFFVMLPLAFFIGTILAKKIKGMDFFKFVFFAPIVVSSVMIGLIWNFILDPGNGLLNSVLRKIGLDFLALEWIGGRVLSPYSIAFICIWQWLGINIVIFMTGIKAIPASIFESAIIDGAKDRHTAIFITLPLVKESIISSAILNVAGVFKVYDLIVTLTSGGPGYSSCTAAMYMMIKMFDSGLFGYGSAISTSILIITSILSILLLIYNKKTETYEL